MAAAAIPSELPIGGGPAASVPGTGTGAPAPDEQIDIPNPLNLLGSLDPRDWASAVLESVIETVAGSLIEALRGFVDWALGLGDSSLNIITQTPAAGTYESTTVRALWDFSRGIANAGLAVIVMWGGFNVALKQHTRSPYDGVMELLPPGILAALAVNLTLEIVTVLIDLNNAFAAAVGENGLPSYDQATVNQAGMALVLVAVTYALVALLLAFQMLMRLALICVLIVLAPFDTVFPILERFGQWIYDNKPLLVAAIGAIGLSVVLALGPVSGAVLAIAGMITAIGFLRDNWGSISEAIKGSVSGMADAVKVRLDDVVKFFGDLPGRIGSGMSALAEKVVSPFRAAFDGIREIINAFIWKWNSLEIKVPSVDVPLVGTLGGFTVGTPPLQPFDTGGIVPGRLGQPVPILAHGGETVLPTHRRPHDVGDRIIEIHSHHHYPSGEIETVIQRVNEYELTRGNRLAGGMA